MDPTRLPPPPAPEPPPGTQPDAIDPDPDLLSGDNGETDQDVDIAGTEADDEARMEPDP